MIDQGASRRRYLIGAVVIGGAILISIVGLTKLDLAPEHHLDGQGPLGSFGDASSSITMAFDQRLGGPSWSVGLELCLARGDQPAVLDGAVGPTKIVGSGFQYLGAFICEVNPGAEGMGSRSGFPPQVSEVLQPVTGYVVKHHCQHPIVDPSIPTTELVLGFGRTSDNSGGGWLGVDVGYKASFRHHVVSLDYNFLICGSAAPPEYCQAPTTPTPSA